MLGFSAALRTTMRLFTKQNKTKQNCLKALTTTLGFGSQAILGNFYSGLAYDQTCATPDEKEVTLESEQLANTASQGTA